MNEKQPAPNERFLTSAEMSHLLLERSIMVDFGDTRTLEQLMTDYGLPTTTVGDMSESTETAI